MDDLGGVDTHNFHAAAGRHDAERAVLWVAAIQVVGNSPAQSVEFDPGANEIAIFGRSIHRHWQMLGFQHLQLHRYRQTIFWATVTDTHQGFTAFEHGSAGHCLEPIEVGQAGGIRRFCPITPEGLNTLAQRRIDDHGLRFDAGTDGVGRIGFERRIGPGVAPHQIAAFGAQFILSGEQCSDSTGIADRPRDGASP